MPILLVRHADSIAESSSVPDEHRTLSPAGRQQVRELSALLAEAGVALGSVVTSPLVRAVQTAELLARWLAWEGPIEASSHLSPVGRVGRAAEWLRRSAEPLGGAVLAAVGHEPTISRIAGHLGGVSISSFAKAEACLVEDGSIRWRLTP